MAPRGSRPAPSFKPTRRRVRSIVRRLERAYGPRPWKPSGDPLGGLVRTILSQHTNDANSHAAYEGLRARFPTWPAVLKARTRDVERAIRCGGLARQKAGRIRMILAQIKGDRGRLDLGFLADWPADRAVEYLCGFNGVGPKTAACVMMFNLGRPMLPVDTHVHRVSARLGLISAQVDADQAHKDLQALCPDELVWPFHVLLIEHGRQTCRSRNPLCGNCPLAEVCPHSLAAAKQKC
jgi:endonuclease III